MTRIIISQGVGQIAITYAVREAASTLELEKNVRIKLQSKEKELRRVFVAGVLLTAYVYIEENLVGELDFVL